MNRATTVVMPSMLSSMLMEFIMPTTQITVSSWFAHAAWKMWMEVPLAMSSRAQATWVQNLSTGLVL
jgi:hypothetical protein